MRARVTAALGLLLGFGVVLSVHLTTFAQQGAADAVNGAGRSVPHEPDNRPFDARDLSGVWRGTLYSYGRTVPPFTAEGQKRFDAHKPSYGIGADSPESRSRSDVHIGRRRAVPPAVGNDPVGRCNPLGLMRLILYSPSPMEIVHAPGRVIQFFEWTWDHREVWTDGRALPKAEDYLPRWNGYSVGRWEGDTFVVETVGFDERQWVDHYGYPVSNNARLQERWRRVNYSSLEVRMTVTDPLVYQKPWESDLATFRLVPPDNVSPTVWNALVEDKCVPFDNDPFYEEAVKPAAGVKTR